MKPEDAKHTAETVKLVLDMIFAVLDRIEKRRKERKAESEAAK